ncbi:MAG: hypothetical protein WBQ76_09660 [Candidatus Korobacteraceae bacterium]
MPVDDVVNALQGFAGAYGKVASQVDPSHVHQLKVTAIRQHSFDVWIVAGMFAASQLKDLETITDAAKFVFRTVADIISLKKHTRGKPYQVSVTGNNNNVLVLNADGAELAVPIEVFAIFKERLLDQDLNKIASPLRENSVDEADLIADEGTAQELEAKITSSERDYFRPDSSTIQIRDLDLVGTLISLNKESNRGTFKLAAGNVQYHYVGDSPEMFHAQFAHEGLVRAVCKAEFDENGIIQRVDIISVQVLQADLGFPEA